MCGQVLRAEGAGRAEALSVFGEHSVFQELLGASVPAAGEPLRGGQVDTSSERRQVAAQGSGSGSE